VAQLLLLLWPAVLDNCCASAVLQTDTWQQQAVQSLLKQHKQQQQQVSIFCTVCSSSCF
jgi:hypothetical protein